MPEFDSTISYRDIPCLPGRKVGSDGTVWTCLAPGTHKPTNVWRQLKPQKVRSHYAISVSRGKTMYIHRLVLEAFVGPCPSGMECRHFPDRNPSNNCLDNLQWGTPLENNHDRFFHGTSNKGERHGMAKLTSDDVINIRKEINKGRCKNRSKIAAMFGVCRETIRKIEIGVNWAHVQ